MGNFQNIFRKLRTSSNLTQNAIAEKLGISRSTIGMYETGAREPDFETLEKIADYFNVDTDFLHPIKIKFQLIQRTSSPPSRWKKIFLQLMPGRM